MNSSEVEIESGERFAFGANWALFLRDLDEARIERAAETLCEMLQIDSLVGRRFIDIGSGSGLFSLAAKRLGAQVHSLDYDGESVACTAELKRRYFPDDDGWTVEQASVLDDEHLRKLGEWDVVYSWGVLHHTGDMWQALENVAPLVAPGGMLYIAIYNDQGGASRRWAWVKKTYNAQRLSRPFLLLYGLYKGWAANLLVDAIKLHPFRSWRHYRQERGMSPWRDNVDWVGGWPFEVATPDVLVRFYHDRGFQLTNLITRQGWGCNELAFRRADAAA